jgi:glycosyltransferase involved in cell wall biosynthesis
MKVSCILTSFNRPVWIKDSLRSIKNQTHGDVQLIVIDESETFDIHKVVESFHFTDVIVKHFDVKPEERRLANRLSINCNLGLSLAAGELICFLADDDYFYPSWFGAAVQHFRKNPTTQAGFGRLVYSDSIRMVLPEDPAPSKVRWYREAVKDPMNKLDHNQVIHRRFDPPFRWPDGAATIGGPDGYYFREISDRCAFEPIDAFTAVKRLHKKGLMESQAIYLGGAMEGSRE